jgi:helicase
MGEVAPDYDLEQSTEEYVANAIVCHGKEEDIDRVTGMMVGSVEPALDELLLHDLVKKSGNRIELTALARVMAEHFIGVERLLEIMALVRKLDDPVEIVAELECVEHGEARDRKPKNRENKEEAPERPAGRDKKQGRKRKSRRPLQR